MTKRKKKPARSTRDRDISQRGVKFIANFEGFESHVYPDSGGIPTIGFGHTKGVTMNTRPITRTKGLAFLHQDLADAVAAVNRMVTAPVNQHEFDMAVSFAFNVGAGGLQQSSFLHDLNAGKRRQAADALKLWVKDAHGVVQPGLVRRRSAERRIFLRGYHPNDR
jgi:lysozyme